MREVRMIGPEDLGLDGPQADEVCDSDVVQLRTDAKKLAYARVTHAAEGSYFRAILLDDVIAPAGTEMTIAYDCVFRVEQSEDAKTAYAMTEAKAAGWQLLPAALQFAVTVAFFVALARGHRDASAVLTLVAVAAASAPFARALFGR